MMGVLALLGALRTEAAEPVDAAEPRGQVFVDGSLLLNFSSIAYALPAPAFGLEYEHALGRYVSLHLTARSIPFRDSGLGRTYIPVHFAPGVRFYPAAQRALTGFWFGPQLTLAKVEFISDGRVRPSPAFVPGLGAGYTFEPAEHLAVSAGLITEVWMGMGVFVTFSPRVAVGYRF